MRPRSIIQLAAFPIAAFPVAALLVCFAASFSPAVEIGEKPALSFTTPDGSQINLKDYRGKLVIVDFFSVNVEASRDEESHLVMLAKDHTDDGVAIIGVCFDRDPAKAHEFLESIGARWPVWFGSQSAADLMQQWNHPGFGPVLLAPDGSVLWHGWYGQLDEHLDDALVTHPPTMVDPDLLAKAQAALDAAAKSFAAGDNIAAFKSLALVPPEAINNRPFARRLDDLQPITQKAIGDLLAPADAMVAHHQNIAAIDALNDLLKSLLATPAEIPIRDRIASLQNDPSTKSQLQEIESDIRASAALAHARALRDDGDVGQAYQELKKLVADYPGSAAALSADAMVGSFEKDPQAMRTVNQQIEAAKAERVLAIARGYASAGLNDKAREKFQEVIDLYPDTPQADAARKEMGALQ